MRELMAAGREYVAARKNKSIYGNTVVCGSVDSFLSTQNEQYETRSAKGDFSTS